MSAKEPDEEVEGKEEDGLPPPGAEHPHGEEAHFRAISDTFARLVEANEGIVDRGRHAERGEVAGGLGVVIPWTCKLRVISPMLTCDTGFPRKVLDEQYSYS